MKNLNLYDITKHYALRLNEAPLFKFLLFIFVFGGISTSTIYAQINCAELSNLSNLSVESTNTDIQTITFNSNTWLPAVAGLSPTEGSEVLHFNTAGDGSFYLPLGTITQPGVYELTFDVGNFNNLPLSVYSGGIYEGGSSNASPGTILPGLISTEPTPGSGIWDQGFYRFTVPTDVAIGQSIGLFVEVPSSAPAETNIAFDNFRFISNITCIREFGAFTITKRIQN